MQQQRQTALVTGASSGIGMELARLLADDGHDLILVARRHENLNRLAEELKAKSAISVAVMPMDLSQPRAAEQLWSAVRDAGHTVDILINNAGTATMGPFSRSDLRETEGMMQLNMLALTALTHCALSDMLQRRRGRILNVASLAGYQPGGPGMAVYYATKSYVLAFTRALSRELRGPGVTVTALCPGPTHTEFEQRSGAGRLRLYRWLKPMDAHRVASAGYRAMLAGRVSCVPGLFNKLLAVGGELPPRRIALEINRILLQ